MAQNIRYLTLLFALITSLKLSGAEGDDGEHRSVRVKADVIVCPHTTSANSMPTFSEVGCFTSSYYRVNPKDQLLWIKARLTVPENLLKREEPLGVFVSGKAAMEVWVEGKLIGRNGSPSLNKSREQPGKMDAVIHINRALLHAGDNDIVLRVSGHHSLLALNSPMHNLSIAPYTNPVHSILHHYWRSLLPLGVLLIGAVYFGVLAWYQSTSASRWGLPMMSLVAAVQLCAEVSRGLLPYDYPMHDIRLITILICSLTFGLLVVWHVCKTLDVKHQLRWFSTAALLSITLVYFIPGFDFKSAFAFAVPILLALMLACYKFYCKQAGAKLIAAGIAIFLLSVFMSPGYFLDIYFFYLVAGFVLILFVQHSREFTREQTFKAQEKARADKLQLILDQNQMNLTKPTIQVKSAGKTEIISISDLMYCQGAGDYVELVLRSGKNMLHSDKLVDMEASLPTTFVRVHRSYIVNTAEVRSIERKDSGTGLLTLANGESIPVSRRIMPSVRERIEQQALVN